MTFFNNKDAFGSISHSLIDHTLERYNIPVTIQNDIDNLRPNLRGTVCGLTLPLPVHGGVIEGDRLIPNIFITVCNPLMEYLKSKAKHDYRLD